MLLELRQFDEQTGLDEVDQFHLDKGCVTVGRAAEPLDDETPHISVSGSWVRVSRFHIHIKLVDGVAVARAGPPRGTDRSSSVGRALAEKFAPRLLNDGDELVLYSDSADLKAATRAVFLTAGAEAEEPTLIQKEISIDDTLPPGHYRRAAPSPKPSYEEKIEKLVARLEEHTSGCSLVRREMLGDFEQAMARQEADLQQFRVELQTESLARAKETEEIMRQVAESDAQIWKTAVFAVIISVSALTIGNFIEPEDEIGMSEYLEVVSEAIQVVPPILAALGLGYVASNASKSSKESLAGLAKSISSQAKRRKSLAEKGASYPISEREMRQLGVSETRNESNTRQEKQQNVR